MNRDYYLGAERDGIRHWGKYATPFAFNIIVNDMKDVLKHEDFVPNCINVSITSSLVGGVPRIGGYYGE